MRHTLCFYDTPIFCERSPLSMQLSLSQSHSYLWTFPPSNPLPKQQGRSYYSLIITFRLSVRLRFVKLLLQFHLSPRLFIVFAAKPPQRHPHPPPFQVQEPSRRLLSSPAAAAAAALPCTARRQRKIIAAPGVRRRRGQSSSVGTARPISSLEEPKALRAMPI